jgi:DNA-binding protein HU-beta
MNKSELVSAVANKTDLGVKQTEDTINVVFEVITEVMEKKDKVTLVGFGTFGTSDRAARDGVNPSTGEKIKISARTVPTFKAGKALKEKVK